MTQSFSELTSEQRLQQTEILLATAAKMINQLTYKQDRNTQAIEQIAQRQDRNTQAIEQLTHSQDRNTQAIEQLTQKQDRNTQAIEQLTQQQDRNSKAIAENIEGIKNLRLSLAQTIDLFNDSMKVIKQMQSEIRGMQTENQRMLRHLFGEDQP